MGSGPEAPCLSHCRSATKRRAAVRVRRVPEGSLLGRLRTASRGLLEGMRIPRVGRSPLRCRCATDPMYASCYWFGTLLYDVSPKCLFCSGLEQDAIPLCFLGRHSPMVFGSQLPSHCRAPRAAGPPRRKGSDVATKCRSVSSVPGLQAQAQLR